MRGLILHVAAGILISSTAALAQDADVSRELRELRKIVEAQQKTISALLERIDSIEAGQESPGDYLEGYEGAGHEGKKKSTWIDGVEISGDLRYRHEFIDDDRKDRDRHRQRIRARLNLDAAVNEDVDLHFQLATGEEKVVNGHSEGDLASNNQTLTNAFTGKNIWMTNAYFDWHPDSIPGLNIYGGKIKRPFLTVGKSELIWDSDLNPEGGVLEYTAGIGESFTATAMGHGFWTVERSSDADSALFGAQASLRHDFQAGGEGAHVLAGAGYFDHTHLEGRAPFVSKSGKPVFSGNSPDGTGAALKDDYDLLELFGEVGFKVGGFPLLLFADYVKNTEAHREDTGWSVGLVFGKAKDVGSWQVRYLYKDLERDAVLGAFTDSDFGGGQTGARGHELGVKVRVAEHWDVAATFFSNTADTGRDQDDESFKRLQLDLIFKF